ncbi:hypothetical protein S7711_02450 [Stachybotrys chartarum IBT 7711]|uniref:Uncharacterized protein n=1 Tax=Stachybotrys chartarum (strain CBS 109288 / IBT 7711) TaxID=1280523 RepID=A0A084AQF3_STACB|nr:hypothetical protein S7711_02450 [Stachybotrys chartarum IBT 7711]KFA48482.1 hypothetical protein S40293_00266 [Stachybotrys chartarum IBT 40293]KFA73231.1 hypothetical protein S40288_05403 [Stachybotrys chartarum IBT 40288]
MTNRIRQALRADGAKLALTIVGMVADAQTTRLVALEGRDNSGVEAQAGDGFTRGDVVLVGRPSLRKRKGMESSLFRSGL